MNARTLLISTTLCLVMYSSAALALSTDEMLRLKRAGVPEETIVLIVQNGYSDINKVLALKDAGFKDENIRAIITAESKAPAPVETIQLRTAARAKIMRYLIFRGQPVLQNSQVVDKAVLSLTTDGNLKLEWKERGGLGLLDALKKKRLESPFYWSINPKEDSLGPGDEGFAYQLRSGANHQGMPETDKDHYWLFSFEPEERGIAEAIKKKL